MYGTARQEMQEQLTEFLAKYKALDERKRAQLDAGEITEDDYRIWLQNQVFQSDLMRQKLDGTGYNKLGGDIHHVYSWYELMTK